MKKCFSKCFKVRSIQYRITNAELKLKIVSVNASKSEAFNSFLLIPNEIPFYRFSKCFKVRSIQFRSRDESQLFKFQ